MGASIWGKSTQCHKYCATKGNNLKDAEERGARPGSPCSSTEVGVLCHPGGERGSRDLEVRPGPPCSACAGGTLPQACPLCDSLKEQAWQGFRGARAVPFRALLPAECPALHSGGRLQDTHSRSGPWRRHVDSWSGLVQALPTTGRTGWQLPPSLGWHTYSQTASSSRGHVWLLVVPGSSERNSITAPLTACISVLEKMSEAQLHRGRATPI